MIRKYIIAICVSVLSLTAFAQKQPKVHSQAHKQNHSEFIAKQSSPLDKSRVNSFVQEDVINHELTSSLSSESIAMLDDILKEGNKHLGKRYVHGAKGPSTFDCSGFTSYVYKQFGYNISPSSRVQYTEGVPVSNNELRKGDLVFFTSRSSGNAVGHVGIVVSADNATGKFKFIHASIKGVKISENEGYYKSRYIGARRIITK